MPVLLEEELQRYHRQIMLPGFGREAQQKLKSAKVLVVGAGGLGCPVLQYLCGAGVGTLGIVDFDRIELHNLHRQFLYTTSDVGKPKVEVAAQILKAHNPHINIEVYNDIISKKNCEQIIANYDIVVDGSDNFPTRYIVNDTCTALAKPLVYGTILNFEGQLAVFNYKGGFNLRDIFPQPPNPEDTPGCNENGVLGVVPGTLGSYMANACIQVILGTYSNENCLFVLHMDRFGLTKLEMSDR